MIVRVGELLLRNYTTLVLVSEIEGRFCSVVELMVNMFQESLAGDSGSICFLCRNPLVKPFLVTVKKQKSIQLGRGRTGLEFVMDTYLCRGACIPQG